MGWRWVVDARGQRPVVDRKWLLASSVMAVLLIAAMRAFVPTQVAIPLLFVLSVVGIAVDVWIRRRHPERD